MKYLHHLKQFGDIHMLMDPRRLEVLRRLILAPESLTSLGKALGEQPAQVRHHLKQLEAAGLVEQVEARPVRGFVEIIYRATSQAVAFSVLVTPYGLEEHVLVAMAGHDLALELLAKRLAQQEGKPPLFTLPVGSLEALVGMRQGMAHLAGCHLYDSTSGQYNLTFVRHFFPERRMVLLTVAGREMGLMVSPEAAYHPRRLEELIRPGVKFINRPSGSATRLWLDRQLHRMSIPPSAIQGYQQEAATQAEVAEAIIKGAANIGLGQHAMARQQELEFVPLFIERYDLVLPEAGLDEEQYQPLLIELTSDGFLEAMDSLGGYDTAQNGNVTRVG